MSVTQEWLKEKFKEDRVVGENVEYTNMKLTREIEDLKNRIKELQSSIIIIQEHEMTWGNEYE